MKIKNFNFKLPTKLVAKELCEPRDHARMIVLKRDTGEFIDDYFYNLMEYFENGDLIVLNNTEVFPCVLKGKREDGGIIEIKLGSRKETCVWDCIVESIRPFKFGDKLFFGEKEELVATVIEKNSFGTGYLMNFDSGEKEIEKIIEKIGSYFFPIYLPQEIADPSKYQTIYASQWGSMQPPVAGMHFTKELFEKALKKHINVEYITLHIGRLDKLEVQKGEMEIEDHRMYKEYYTISKSTADKINNTKLNKKKVIAVGTTVMRTLEAASDTKGSITARSDWTDLYIYPGYQFKIVDALVSNLQPPLTTNLMLACAFGKHEQVISLYNHAVVSEYKFLEFGDCALYV